MSDPRHVRARATSNQTGPVKMTKVKTSHAQKKVRGAAQSLQATSRAGSSDTLTARARIARRLYNEPLAGSNFKR